MIKTPITSRLPRSRLILPDEFWDRSPSVPDISTFISQRITVALQRGRIPWKVPVSHDPNCGLPCNVRTGGRYRGVNTLLLCDTYHTKGYLNKWWGTAEDWASVGTAIKSGEEPTVIARYRDAGCIVDPCLVYNAIQFHDADEYQVMLTDGAIVANDEADFSLMGILLEHHAPEIRYDVGDERFGSDWNGYISPEPFHDHPNHRNGDYILMQSERYFPFKSDFYSVMLHEIMHWTEVRTGWMHSLPVREFVAEVGMNILGLDLGVPHCLDSYNHYQWLKHWHSIFHKDETFFFWAMAQVDRACDYLLRPILEQECRVYHDEYSIAPPVKFTSGPDHMSFEDTW
jgi:antirestriction protein ArdC